jgi:hypothetical protein
MCRRRSGSWDLIDPLLKLYDFSKGAFTGQVKIPDEDKCLRIKRGRKLPLYTDDMVSFFIACHITSKQYLALSLKVYTSVRRHIRRGAFELELFVKHSKIIPHAMGYIYVTLSIILTGDVALVTTYENNTAYLSLYRDIRQGVTLEDTSPHRLPLMKHMLLVNSRLGMYFCARRSRTSHFLGIEIGKSSKNMLRSKKCDIVRKQRIEIHGSTIELIYQTNVRFRQTGMIYEIRRQQKAIRVFSRFR